MVVFVLGWRIGVSVVLFVLTWTTDLSVVVFVLRATIDLSEGESEESVKLTKRQLSRYRVDHDKQTASDGKGQGLRRVSQRNLIIPLSLLQLLDLPHPQS